MIGETPDFSEAQAPAAPPSEHSAEPTTYAEAAERAPLAVANDEFGEDKMDAFVRFREADEVAKRDPEEARRRREEVARELAAERDRLYAEADPAAAEAAEIERRQRDIGIREGEQSAAAREEAIRRDADFSARAQEYARQNPGFAKAVDNVAILDLKPHVIETLKSSPAAAEMLHQIGKNLSGDNADWMGAIEASNALNQMSPAQLRTEFARAEGILEGQKRWRDSRKVTQAPPPMRRVTGGASPSRSVEELGESGDMDAFIAARERQEKAARRR